jgi:hypothetical protein
MAARFGLTFHCDGFYIIEHDDSRQHRQATQPELSMWQMMVGAFDPECLPATVEEVRDSFAFLRGPFTMHTEDVGALRRLTNFEPCTDKPRLLEGLVGWVKRAPSRYLEDSPFFLPAKAPVYVTTRLQPGYFHEGDRIPQLHTQPPSDPRELTSELTEEIENKVLAGLRPFMMQIG